MKQKIFVNVFLVMLGVFAASMAITMTVLYQYYSEQKKLEFQEEGEYLCNILEQVEEPESVLIVKGEQKSGFRVTLVAPDGTVRYDSTVEAESLENHRDREEIIQALQNGTGESTRYSDTLAEKTYNYAIRMKDGSVLRVSGEQYTVLSLIVSMMYPIVLILFVVLAVSILIAYRISRSVIEPINNIDLERPNDKDIYPELRPLARRVNAQNRQLHRQMTELREEHEKQDRLRREFTANVSHELKTPLTSISGYAEILGAGMVKEADIPVFSRRIYDEAQRLIALVGDIIKLSQLEDNEVSVEKKQVDLYELAQKNISHLQAAADKKSVQLKLCGTHQYITGVEEILEEMVYNLIDNAIKYNRENGTVTVTVNGPSAEEENAGVQFTVTDTGIGIPKDEISRIYERFYRVDKSHSKEVGGTGLGLSIVKHGAVYHNAQIETFSTLGEGTTIRIQFPQGNE